MQNYGRPLQLSLFEPVLARQFDSDLERNFARYLDEQKALHWWHRVAVRQQGDYYLRGWNGNASGLILWLWPGIQQANRTFWCSRPKAEHLKGKDDTQYKLKVFETLERAFNAGTMKINDGPAKGTFRLVFNDAEFPKALASLNGAYKPDAPTAYAYRMRGSR